MSKERHNSLYYWEFSLINTENNTGTHGPLLLFVCKTTFITCPGTTPSLSGGSITTWVTPVKREMNLIYKTLVNITDFILHSSIVE